MVAKVSNWSFTSPARKYDDEIALTNAIANIGPITVCIYVTSAFQNYASGVFYDSGCTRISRTTVNHAVLAVGYGIYNITGQQYYLVKNMWGTSWGMKGYMFMSRNRSNNCNIASYASYPIGV